MSLQASACVSNKKIRYQIYIECTKSVKIEYRTRYQRLYSIAKQYRNNIYIEQGGLLPALDRNPADVISGSEHILKAYADKHSLTATAIVDLIKMS